MGGSITQSMAKLSLGCMLRWSLKIGGYDCRAMRSTALVEQNCTTSKGGDQPLLISLTHYSDSTLSRTSQSVAFRIIMRHQELVFGSRSQEPLMQITTPCHN